MTSRVEALAEHPQHAPAQAEAQAHMEQDWEEERHEPLPWAVQVPQGILALT